MSAGNVNGVLNRSVKPNGTTTRGTAGSRGSTGPRANAVRAKRLAPVADSMVRVKPLPELAGFLKTESAAQDAPMWAIHPFLWLEPELRLAVPAFSGLHIERTHTVPAPDAVRIPMTAVNHTAPSEKLAQPVRPLIGRHLPTSDLAPLGWDPRLVSPGAGKDQL